MPVREYIYEVTVSERDIPVLLDMLRYDGATVERWDRATIGRGQVTGYTIRLRSTRYTPDRWASFLVFPQEVN